MADYSISYMAGIFVSFIFKWFPWVKTWYAKYTPKQKQIVMGAAMAIVTVFIAGLSCTNIQIVGLPSYECTPQGLGDLITQFFFALTGAVTGHKSTNKL